MTRIFPLYSRYSRYEQFVNIHLLITLSWLYMFITWLSKYSTGRWGVIISIINYTMALLSAKHYISSVNALITASYARNDVSIPYFNKYADRLFGTWILQHVCDDCSFCTYYVYEWVANDFVSHTINRYYICCRVQDGIFPLSGFQMLFREEDTYLLNSSLDSI